MSEAAPPPCLCVSHFYTEFEYIFCYWYIFSFLFSLTSYIWPGRLTRELYKSDVYRMCRALYISDLCQILRSAFFPKTFAPILEILALYSVILKLCSLVVEIMRFNKKQGVLIVKYLISLTKRNSFNLVLPPSIPYFYQLRRCRFLGLGCTSLMHGYHRQPIVLEFCNGIFSRFSITSCKVFFTCLGLGHFCSGPYLYSPLDGKYIFFRPFWPVFHSVFCYGFPPGLSFGCFTIQASIFYHLCRLC